MIIRLRRWGRNQHMHHTQYIHFYQHEASFRHSKLLQLSMIKKQLLHLLLCIAPLGMECIYAQQKETYAIQGTIDVRTFSGQLHATLIDATGQTVADSILRERTFRILPTLPGVYRLTLKTEGYQEVLRTVHPTVENPVVKLGEIPMRILQEIDKVVVTGERSFVRNTAKGFVYDVVSDPDAKKLKINEFFGKVPGVWNDQSKGNIIYEDNRKYLILINGKKHAMISASRQYAMNHIQAGHMKTIEVMDPYC